MDSQKEVIAFLSRPGVLDRSGGEPERLETHISIIFLAGPLAFKLKRAVRFPYLDFTTSSLRHAACEAEVAINRRTAPGLYLGVVAVTRAADGSLHLGGIGEPIDWLVEMARFEQAALFDHLACERGLDRHIMENLARTVARFHERAEPVAGFGGSDGLRSIIDGIGETFRQDTTRILDPGETSDLIEAIEGHINGLAPILDRRRQEGKIRRCHGDLHLCNIVLLDGVPTLFDAIEFNPSLVNIDVLYDLAFLLMDLDHRNLRRLASIVFNSYMDGTDDCGDLAVLPLFLSVRAAIRAHVAVSSAAAVPEREKAAQLGAEAWSYLRQAFDTLKPAPPRLIAVGGLSGSGKSRLGREMAPSLGLAPGARVVRSDVIRKNLAGVEPATRLGGEGYSTEVTERTYQALYDQAGEALAGGQAVVADAVFARPEQRHAIAEIALKAGVPFDGLWLEAPLEIMEDRVTHRRNNASDAGVEVVRRQLGYDLGVIEWTKVDSRGPREETLKKGLERLGVEHAAV